MRYLLPVIALVACFSIPSCVKQKVPDRGCYQCVRNDSVSSNIPKLANPKKFTATTALCDITLDQSEVFEKTHTSDDTTYYSNDTVVITHVRTVCEFNY